MAKPFKWPAGGIVLLGMVLGGTCHPGGAVARQAIATAEFLVPHWSGGLLANAAFVPEAGAAPAHMPFRGTLSLAETEMTVKPRALGSRWVLGRDAALFPGVAVSFFTAGGDLVPFTQNVIRCGSTASGRSFWDIIVQPGRVWSEPQDGEWSRAAFPFALVNSMEGETHNGLATFLYKAGRVSNLRFQIVQQTAPFHVKDRFFAAGLVAAVLVSAPVVSSGDDAMLRRYEASLKNAVHVADWRALSVKVGADRLAGFDGRMRAGDIVLAGLDYEGTFYLKQCVSAAGPLPWCDRARFGIGSVTAALAEETALLRLAAKYGPSVFDLKLADYVPALAGHPGWNEVRFEDAIDMATGMGSGTAKRDPNDIRDGYSTDDHPAWYEARSTQDKLNALIELGRVYPWGPGQAARYRDQDMFLLGLAMNNFLKSKEGASADLWSMLDEEVFEPIGIFYAPTNRTIETDGSPGQPLMAFGYYPTIADMVRIARLYQNRGKQGGAQVLYEPRLAAVLASREPRGLPTGEQLTFGQTLYTDALWRTPYRSGECVIYYPRMIGRGGNIVALLPNGITGLHIAKSGGATDGSDNDTAGMATVAERLGDFCR